MVYLYSKGKIQLTPFPAPRPTPPLPPALQSISPPPAPQLNPLSTPPAPRPTPLPSSAPLLLLFLQLLDPILFLLNLLLLLSPTQSPIPPPQTLQSTPFPPPPAPLPLAPFPPPASQVAPLKPLFLLQFLDPLLLLLLSSSAHSFSSSFSSSAHCFSSSSSFSSSSAHSYILPHPAPQLTFFSSSSQSSFCSSPCTMYPTSPIISTATLCMCLNSQYGESIFPRVTYFFRRTTHQSITSK